MEVREMKLATILTGVTLVLALAVLGCDNGGEDENTTGTGKDTVLTGDDGYVVPELDGSDSGCDDACEGKCGAVGDCNCGACDPGFTCVEATHTCAPEAPDCNTVCTGKECGTFEGCDCGVCADGFTCNATTGVCEDICPPNCTGKQCGPDGCGGSCGLCPCVGCDPAATQCNDDTGMCEAAEALTCSGINDCMAACNPDDNPCLQDCMNQGSTDAQNQLNALIQCLINNGGQQCTDAQCQNDIIMEFCMAEYTACFPGGDMTCSEMFDCMETCGQDQDCLQECYNNSTIEAQGQYQAIASCVIEQCGEQPTEECFMAAQQGACAAVFADCFNLGKPGFAGGPNGGSSSDFVNIKHFLMALDKDKLYN